MSIEISEVLDGEKEFLILDDVEDEKGFFNGVKVHPWDRPRRYYPNDRSVYVSTGWFGEHGEIAKDDEGIQEYHNVIVNREDFVEAILAVFPELKRADV